MKKGFYDGVTQIISYRFKDNLTEPYDKIDTHLLSDDSFECVQERVTNYGKDNGIVSRVLFRIPRKEFKVKTHWEAVKHGSRTNN